MLISAAISVATLSDGSSVVRMDAPPDKDESRRTLFESAETVWCGQCTCGGIGILDTDLVCGIERLWHYDVLTAMFQEQGEAAHKALLLEAPCRAGLVAVAQVVKGFCPNITVKRCCAKSTCSRNGLSQRIWARINIQTTPALAANRRYAAAAPVGAAQSLCAPRLYRPQPDADARQDRAF